MKKNIKRSLLFGFIVFIVLFITEHYIFSTANEIVKAVLAGLIVMILSFIFLSIIKKDNEKEE